MWAEDEQVHREVGEIRERHFTILITGRSGRSGRLYFRNHREIGRSGRLYFLNHREIGRSGRDEPA
jgi:hypothetical protein